MIDEYAGPEEVRRLFSALLAVVIAVSIFALFAFIVVPGLRSANHPPARRLPVSTLGRTGWLDPLEFPAARGYLLPPVDPKTVMAPTPRMLERGRALFAENCAACHGEAGRGDGPSAKGLSPAPRDFTRAEAWKNGSGLPGIFKTLSEGVRSSAMSSFDTLSRRDRMALAHHVRSLGSFPKGEGDAKALKELSDSFASTGERVPARIPLSLAMERLEAEYLSGERKR